MLTVQFSSIAIGKNISLLSLILLVFSALPANATFYFKANGTQPVWNMDIADDQIIFNSSTVGFERFVLPSMEPTRSENGGIKTYKVKSKEAEVEIQLIDQLCENPNSHERFPYTVSVSVKRMNDKTPTIFSGCGLYVPDNRLHGRWTIESIKGVVVPDSVFKEKQPYLELAVDGSYFTCFAGCNTISGRLFFERSILRFTDLVLSKDTCDQIAFEKSVISALQFTTQFSILRDRLALGNPSSTTMNLARVE